jgi:hypothetical protein
MPFEAGQSGNPGGRSKTKPFADALRMELAAAGKDHKALRTIARNLIGLASDDGGKLEAIKELADRLDGKVPQAVVGDSDEDPINLVHRIERVIVRPKD